MVSRFQLSCFAVCLAVCCDPLIADDQARIDTIVQLEKNGVELFFEPRGANEDGPQLIRSVAIPLDWKLGDEGVDLIQSLLAHRVESPRLILFGLPKVSQERLNRLKEAFPQLSIKCLPAVMLGVLVEPNFNSTAVRMVLPDSGADKAGLVADNVIEEINGTKVDGFQTLKGALIPYRPGQTIPIKISRDGHSRIVLLKLGHRPGR